jgi:hypothetical protein
VRKQALAALWIAAGLYPAASQAQTFTGFPPAVPPLTGAEQVPADTGVSPPSVRITTTQLGQFVNSLNPSGNWLIAGDASQNLWQRGTTGPVSSGTVLFGPDRWAYWSGSAATPIQVSEDTTPIVTLPGFKAAYKMQRQAGSTGTDMMCMAQEISSANSVPLQGQFVEMDFYVFGGANLSATNVGIYIVAGTGTDEGVGALAAGFSGGAGWTGQSRVVGALFSPLFIGRVTQPAVVGLVPTTATELAVVLCMTPNGTAGTNDWMDFSGIQLRTAPVLASFASKFTAYTAWSLPTPPFVWRLGVQEAALQEAYYWRINEGPGFDTVQGGCRSVAPSLLVSDCFIQFPVLMRQAPTMTYTVGFETDADTGGDENCTGLGTASWSSVVTNRGVTVSCTAAANVKAASFLYEHGGAGMIAADAELH